jgi:hypothetical protein
LASLAYPGTRILTFPLILLLPGLGWKKKSYSMAILSILLMPVFWRSLVDPRFTARAEMLVLWSSHPMSPHHDAGALEIMWAAILNGLSHLSPDFLLLSGDRNLRHSTGVVGMMSPVEYLLLVGGALAGVFMMIRRRVFPSPQVRFLLVGALLGILPSALTWESVPHSLRAIAAWPFFVVLGALAYRKLVRAVPLTRPYFLLCCSGFAVFLGNAYFGNWTSGSEAWFQTENNTLGRAYSRLARGEASCEDITREIEIGPFRTLK